MVNEMKNAMSILKELRGKETFTSLIHGFKTETEKKDLKKPLKEKPSDVFNEMESDNEIRGNYTKLEFLKMAEKDVAIAITDIHGDREKLGAVLDYIKKRKEEIEGKIHLINMGDIASGSSDKEDSSTLIDLLKGSSDGDFKLHMLEGNVERDAAPVSNMVKKIKETENDYSSLSHMTDLFDKLPSSLFLKTKNGDMMLTHSTLPLVSKNGFEKEGLAIFNRDAEDIDKTGIRKHSASWAAFDGEKEESEYGGKKVFKLGKNTFRSILKTLDLKRILRGHDSGLIEEKAKDTGVHQTMLEEGEVDTFHTSKKATGEFGVFAEITGDGKIEFKQV